MECLDQEHYKKKEVKKYLCLWSNKNDSQKYEICVCMTWYECETFNAKGKWVHFYVRTSWTSKPSSRKDWYTFRQICLTSAEKFEWPCFSYTDL